MIGKLFAAGFFLIMVKISALPQAIAEPLSRVSKEYSYFFFDWSCFFLCWNSWFLKLFDVEKNLGE